MGIQRRRDFLRAPIIQIFVTQVGITTFVTCATTVFHPCRFGTSQARCSDGCSRICTASTSLHLPEHVGILAAALDQATEKLLDEGKSPSRKVNEIDDRGSHFYLSLYWAEALAARTDDAELASAFGPTAAELREKAEQIDAELLAAQGQPADLGGYYWPDEEKTTAVMRPSETSNAIVDGLKK